MYQLQSIKSLRGDCFAISAKDYQQSVCTELLIWSLSMSCTGQISPESRHIGLSSFPDVKPASQFAIAVHIVEQWIFQELGIDCIAYSLPILHIKHCITIAVQHILQWVVRRSGNRQHCMSTSCIVQIAHFCIALLCVSTLDIVRTRTR